MGSRGWIGALAIGSLALAVLFAAPTFRSGVAHADPMGSYFYLTPFGGYTLFDDSLHLVRRRPIADDLYAGGRLGWQMSSMLALEAAGGFTPANEDTTGGGDVDFLHASGNLVLTPVRGRWGAPFLSAGAGYRQLKAAAGDLKKDGVGYEGAVGLNLWLTDLAGIRLEARDVMFQDDDIDKLVHNFVVGGGITFAIGGRARDTDGDGVPDRRDKCPDTPKGATVDDFGCQHDSDGDGVLDGLDKCPNTPKGATVDATGCPHDADDDGVLDGLDKCPDTPKGATVDASGCPHDSDNDGVLDGLDKCPDTIKGCTVDSEGCPKDSDGDGVCDGLDKCSDTAAGLKVDSEGCPIEAVERETELLDTGMIRLQNVNFETGKADLLAESSPTLDAVGTVLAKWPQLKIEIGGHTDSRGGVSYNQKLSEARAKAVKDYLVQKFPSLDAAQYTVKGYGKSKPLVPNTNDLNMAKNRRVEFVVLNKETLKKEIERRRLLKKDETAPAPAPTPAPPDTTRH